MGLRVSGVRSPARPSLGGWRRATCAILSTPKCERARGTTRGRKVSPVQALYFEWRYQLQVDDKLPPTCSRFFKSCARRHNCTRASQRVNICICNFALMAFMRLTDVLISRKRRDPSAVVCSFDAELASYFRALLLHSTFLYFVIYSSHSVSSINFYLPPPAISWFELWDGHLMKLKDTQVSWITEAARACRINTRENPPRKHLIVRAKNTAALPSESRWNVWREIRISDFRVKFKGRRINIYRRVHPLYSKGTSHYRFIRDRHRNIL